MGDVPIYRMPRGDLERLARQQRDDLAHWRAWQDELAAVLHDMHALGEVLTRMPIDWATDIDDRLARFLAEREARRG